MDTAYIRDIFQPYDRLAVFLKTGERTNQYFVTRAELLDLCIQGWLKEQNKKGANIYVSMNALGKDAVTRTKEDVAEIRNIYLDIDYDADAVLERIKSDVNTPPPNWILKTSPGKYQVVWKATGFSAAAAETLQKSLCLKYGADRAATDVSRVFRIPGYDNHKYDVPYMVTSERLSDRTHTPEDFSFAGRLNEQSSFAFHKQNISRISRDNGANTQSHRDWYETCRRLENGDDPQDVKRWLEATRQDKPNPKYYAELTVNKAIQHITCEIESKNMEDVIKSEYEIEIFSEIYKEKRVDSAGKQPDLEKPSPFNHELYGWQEDQSYRLNGHGSLYYKGGINGLYILADSDGSFEAGNYKNAIPDIEKADFEPVITKQYPSYSKSHIFAEILIKNNFPAKNIEHLKEIIEYAVESYSYLLAPRQQPYTFRDLSDAITNYYDMNVPRNQAVVMSLRAFHDQEFIKTHSGLISVINNLKEKNIMADEQTNDQQKQRHYIEGNGFSVRDELKALGCRFDPDKGRWYHTDLKKAAEAQNIIEIETSAMNNAKEHETREPRHYIEGNSFAVKDKLKELGCRYDADERKWYHTDPDIAKEAQKLVPAQLEKHTIGEAPREMTDELKGMGCKWNKETGWYHNDQETAEKARKRIQEVEPRHYLEGDGYAVKDQLKALECRWDGVQKQWYATNLWKASQAQAILDNAPQREKKNEIEKHYLTGETIQIKDQLKEMGCKWDGEKKQWYHTDPAIAAIAQKLIDTNSGGPEKGIAPKPGDPADGPSHGGETVTRIVQEMGRGM